MRITGTTKRGARHATSAADMVYENAGDEDTKPKKVPLKKQSTFSGLPSVLPFRRTASRSQSVPSVEAIGISKSRSSTQLSEQPQACREEEVWPECAKKRSLTRNRSVTVRPSLTAPSERTPPELLPISILDDDLPPMCFIKEAYDENDNALSVTRTRMSKTDTKVRASSMDVQEPRAKRRSSTRDTSTVRYVGESGNTQQRNRRRSSRNSVHGYKTKLTQLLRTTQLEQLSKLKNKHQQECDLLDDIRNFGKERSQIEKDYGQALQKLAAQYQKKDGSVIVDTEDNDNRTVMAVWKSVLDATDKVAQTRLVASENYKNNIYEAAKNCRTQKEVQLKKCQDLLNTLQNEITNSIKELTKSKKKYYDAEQLTSGAREKFQDVTERLKRNRTGLFKNKAGLEKTVQKLQQRCEENTTNSTVARNEYLLMLSAANAHQRRYYETDMPAAMALLDGNLYEKLQDYLSSMSQIELDVSKTSQEAYAVSAEDATKISREYNVRCFLRENPVFEWGPMYEFEACGSDNNGGKLQAEQSTEDNSLNREARRWAGYVVRDNRQLQRLQKMKYELEDLTQKYAQNPALTTEAAAQETEVRLEKCREDLRRVETSHLQCEARLDMLREAGVDVDTWIESAKAQEAKEASVSHANQIRRQSLHNKSINAQSHIANMDPQSPMTPDGFDDDFYDDETFEDDGHTYADNLSIPSSDHSRQYPMTCTVKYAYKATREDELTIEIGDVIEAVEDGDLDQWVKAKNNQGNVGYVPENYIEFPAAINSPSHHLYCEPPGDDYTLESSSSTSGTSSMTSNSTTSGNDREVRQINSGVHITVSRGVCLAKAMYDYEGCSEEELTFPENAIINILSKNDNGIDDGWWKGEYNGQTGVFPGLVVEELTGAEGDKNDSSIHANISNSPLMDRPPSFQPPPPNECPPPPPDDRNPSPDSGFIPNELALPQVRHQRAHSDPESPVYAQVHKPQRSAPPPPMRPSFLHTKGST